ncbi:MAG: chemotaxis protein CheW [Acidobacteria bacterium]|nr:chemotaxis protein CheW [Acidobacteriota bacterium]
MHENEELVREFLIESCENLDRLDRDLVELEKDPGNRERLSSIFRTIHTIKGTCGFLGFTRLEAVTHIGENLLCRVRSLELRLDEEITTGLLAMVDAVRRILASIEQTGEEPDDDHTGLIAELTRLHALPATGTREPDAVGPPSPAPRDVVPARPPESAPASDAPLAADAVPTLSGGCGGADREGDHGPALRDSSLRVDVILLDKLMNLVGELVLARNQILQFTATQIDSSFIGATGRLNLVTSELQEGVMKTRMQPIGNVWSKFPRIVRDLATQCRKQVRIEMEGRETDLDKTIIEAIKDPLTHIVRNAIDHGIETPDDRLAAGKPADGLLRLRAFHEGGQINIEISDDGAGIDAAKVRAKAIQRGIVTAEQAATMTDHDAVSLVFIPGFSTAEQVTNVSGRGVGMDVVKTNIEKIGGQVDIQTAAGEGTTLRIKIPLTLAIIPALMVASGGERYAIPQVSLLELVRLEGEQARHGIERIQDALFYRLRGNLLPLAYLHRELGLTPAGQTEDLVNIVVLKADGRQFGLVVEEIHDTEEIVVKPLSKQLKGIAVFAGATIMGDGKVALILDVPGIAQRAGVVSGTKDHAPTAAQHAAGESGADTQTLLLFQVGDRERMAIPLHLVSRLEEFPSTSIERSGTREVVQYRNDILPIISLSKFFSGEQPAAPEMRQVIVFSESGQVVGLEVERILDIVSEQVVVRRRCHRPGVLGTAVIQQRVTDLLDVHAVLRAVEPDVLEVAGAA